MGTNEKASDEIDAIDHGTDTTLVAIILFLTMAMTMAIEVTTAPIVMTESIVSATVIVMNDHPFLSNCPPPQNIDTA